MKHIMNDYRNYVVTTHPFVFKWQLFYSYTINLDMVKFIMRTI